MPVQHFSTNVLKRMNRSYTREWYLERIDESSTRVNYTWNGDQGPSFPSYALTTAWKTQGSEMITDLEKSLEKLYKD